MAFAFVNAGREREGGNDNEYRCRRREAGWKEASIDNVWDNLCNLRLSDMGNTTLGVTAPPYDEIAQEAFSVWELFEGKYR